MTIRDFMTKSGTKAFKNYTGEIGLEIETETKSANSYPDGILTQHERTGHWVVPGLKYWDTHPDGSLRDFGLEFVLKQPVLFDKELPAALDEFRDKLGKVKFIKDSITTSVHVHLNMLNESFRTFGNFLTLYTLFENLLIRYSGPDRLSNLFCLPICDAEETYNNIVSMMRNVEKKNYKGLFFTEGSVKYAALNLGAFSQYGSLEIRSFRGETDTKAINDWVTILYSILRYARQDIDPKNIMLSWKDRQTKLLDDVFRDYRKEIAHKDELKLIDQNVWYAASIAYSVKNWRALDEVIQIPEFKPKQKELESNSLIHFGTSWINLDNAQQDHLIRIMKSAYERQYLAQGGGLKKAPQDDWNIRPQPVPNPVGEVVMDAAPARPRAQPLRVRAAELQAAGIAVAPQLNNDELINQLAEARNWIGRGER